MKTFCIKLFCILGFALCITPLQAQKVKFVSLKPVDFKARTEQMANPCIMDIRSAADFKVGHIAGATNLNPDDIRFISELKRLYSETDPIFVYCKMGKTSKSAAQKIVANGFMNVYNLKGGIMAWGKKLPLVTE